jgi:hypothetical protein
MKLLERMWINQPSYLQPLHSFHATNVLAIRYSGNTFDVYFLSGNVISMLVPSNTLSKGWK